MAIFNSFLYVYQRVTIIPKWQVYGQGFPHPPAAKVRHLLRAARTWPRRKAPDSLHVLRAGTREKTWFLMVNNAWDGGFHFIYVDLECLRWWISFQTVEVLEEKCIFDLDLKQLCLGANYSILALGPFVAFWDCWFSPSQYPLPFGSANFNCEDSHRTLPFLWTRATSCTPVPAVSAGCYFASTCTCGN